MSTSILCFLAGTVCMVSSAITGSDGPFLLAAVLYGFSIALPTFPDKEKK